MLSDGVREVVIKGTVENIIYSNTSNGFTVFSMSVDSVDSVRIGNQDEIICTGNLEQLLAGEYMSVVGSYVQHPTYGKQLNIASYEKAMPDTLIGIEKYLGSGLIKGIRDKTAKKIVNKFGEQTFTIIEECPERLSEIKGITLEKAMNIGAVFHEQREMRKVMVFLQQYGISAVYANKIYKRYRERTFEVVKNNPYKLADDIFGIGFKLADSIAAKMGIERESENRIKSGIKYTLGIASNSGHVYLPKEVIIESVSMLLEVHEELIENSLTELHIERTICQEKIKDEYVVYLNHYYYAESYVAKKLIELSNGVANKRVLSEKAVEEMAKRNGVTLAENQKKAVLSIFDSGVLVITGGPGTGKTTTINTIISFFQKDELEIALTAPTGRAAKKMSEATGMEAKTIHRLLEIEFLQEDSRSQRFGKNEENPIEADVIIVDESSMIDNMLMHSLLKAVAEGTRLILVGDVDQLPSVGAGNVLSDIIKSECLKVIRLTEVFRQAQESAIIMNAHRINRGEYPVLKGNEDFFFVKRSSQEEVVEVIVELVAKKLPDYKNCDLFRDIQVITPMRKSPLGVQNLNAMLQRRLNPPSSSKRDKEYGQTIFREGDKVMQVRNNYNITWIMVDKNNRWVDEGLGIFNGDTGVILSIDDSSESMKVMFDDNKVVKYDYTQLDNLELSYAITIHKSQGSEYKVVVMPIYSGPPMLMSRNLLYTAVTRAKEMAVIVGIPETLNRMVDNNREINRYTTLDVRLKNIEKLME